MRILTPLVLVAAFLLAWEPPVEAYLDPGSGSMLIQLLLGGVAGVAVILKLYWRRILDLLHLRGHDRERPGDA
jgi:hypothetical protein